MYQEGQTATNPTTGQKVVYKGGQWVAMEGGNRAASLKPVEQKAVDDAQASARNALDVLPDLNQFQSLNERVDTGKTLNRFGLPTIPQMFDPNAQTMRSITARLAPQQRQAGSGTTSDRDLALYLEATPGIKMDPRANANIIERGRSEAVRRQQYADFLDQYAAQHGTLNGAQQAFRAQVGMGTRDKPYSGTDPATMPRGAYYRDAQGNLRRNDNGPSGNPIMQPAGGQAPQAAQPEKRVLSKPAKQTSNDDLYRIAGLK